MDEIIKIETSMFGDSEVNSVNSREIYEYLEVSTEYSHWIKRAIEKYDFENGVDYLVKNDGVQKLDYIVTLDMAKELCMVSNTVKGKEVRKYFIAVEKKALAPVALTKLEILAIATESEKKYQRQLEVTVLVVNKNVGLKENVYKLENEKKEHDTLLDHIFEEGSGLKIAVWAQMIYDLHKIKIGQKRLFESLRELGYITKDGDNRPYQTFLQQKLFTVKAGSYVRKNGFEVPTYTPLVTPKGIERITPKILEHIGAYR